MKIIVLDCATLGKDLDYSALQNEGEVIFYDTTLPDQIADRISDAEIIITNKVVFDKNQFEVAKKLKLICVAATGYNNINIEEANKRGIAVTNVQSYSTDSVVQQIFAYLLAFYNSTFEYQQAVKAHQWQGSPIFTMLDFPIFELRNKNLGIIGYGTIGKRLAEIAKAFGMNIFPVGLPNRSYTDKRYELDYVLNNADVLSIHTPLNDSTRNLITINELKKMKKNAILVNYARGGIVNEQDLHQALANKVIRGAIVDVLTLEPPKNGNILFDAPNIFITPHTAWTSFEARTKLLKGIVENIKIFKSGKIDIVRIK